MFGGSNQHLTKLPHKDHWHLKQFKNIRQNEPFCLMLKTEPLDFLAFQRLQALYKTAMVSVADFLKQTRL
jgi:hypothetical protein